MEREEYEKKLEELYAKALKQDHIGLALEILDRLLAGKSPDPQ